MDISFVILTWNSEKYIEECIRTLLLSLGSSKYKYEIFVVDNGSVDNSSGILRKLNAEYPDSLFPIFLDKNVGTTVSRNIALKKATGDYICIMDSDVIVSYGIFQDLIDTLREKPSIGMVVPKIVYPDGNWQKSIDEFPTLTNKIKRFVNLRRIELAEAKEYCDEIKSRPVDYAISAFWFFRHNIIDKVGLLDEKIFYSPEDVDFCIRIWKCGYEILYVTNIQVIHHTQELSRGLKLNKTKLSHIKGLIYLFMKHRYFLGRPELGHAENCRSKSLK